MDIPLGSMAARPEPRSTVNVCVCVCVCVEVGVWSCVCMHAYERVFVHKVDACTQIVYTTPPFSEYLKQTI